MNNKIREFIDNFEKNIETLKRKKKIKYTQQIFNLMLHNILIVEKDKYYIDLHNKNEIIDFFDHINKLTTQKINFHYIFDYNEFSIQDTKEILDTINKKYHNISMNISEILIYLIENDETKWVLDFLNNLENNNSEYFTNNDFTNLFIKLNNIGEPVQFEAETIFYQNNQGMWVLDFLQRNINQLKNIDFDQILYEIIKNNLDKVDQIKKFLIHNKEHFTRLKSKLSKLKNCDKIQSLIDIL